MIWAVKYLKRDVKKVNFKDLNFLREIAWIDVNNPTKEEIDALAGKTGISLGDIKDALDPRELPRIADKKSYSVIIFKAINQFSTVPVGIFLGKKFVVTVHREIVESVHLLKKNIHSDLGKLIFKNGLSFLVYRLMLDIIKQFNTSLDKIGEEVDKIEDKILKHSSEEDLRNIFKYKKKLLFIRKALNGNYDVVEDIQKSPFISKNTVDSFLGIKMALLQLISVEGTYRERLTESMNMYMTSVSNNLNEIMRGFTVIASLLLLPMLISGIWGMNFSEIPLFYNPNGFYLVLLIMLIAVFIMFFFFKKRKWV